MFLFGASGHAKVIIEILEKSGETIDGLFDDNHLIRELCGYECTSYDNFRIKNHKILVSIGDNKIRKSVVDRIGAADFGQAIDIRSSVSARAVIGEGSVVMPGATVNSGTNIGKHCIINTNASVDHDCSLGDFIHISPGCSVAGNVKIEEGTQIGIGASIIPNVKIGKWCKIGAGCVIIRDIPDYSVVVGNPGRIIKYNL